MDNDSSKTMENLPNGSSRSGGGKYRTKRRPNTNWGASHDIDQSGKKVPSNENELVDVYIAFEMESKREPGGVIQRLKSKYNLSTPSIIPISHICDYCGDMFRSLSTHKERSDCWKFIRIGKEYQADVEPWSGDEESKMGDDYFMDTCPIDKQAECCVRALNNDDVEVILEWIRVGEDTYRKGKKIDWVASALESLPHLSRSQIVSFFWKVYVQEHLNVEDDDTLFPSYTPSSRKPYNILLPKDCQNGYPWRKEDPPIKPRVPSPINISEVGSSGDRIQANVYKLDTCYEIYALVPGFSSNEVRVRANSSGTVTVCGDPEDPTSC